MELSKEMRGRKSEAAAGGHSTLLNWFQDSMLV
jgi:hypothetical protein